MSMHIRLRKGLGAQGFSQAVIIFCRLAEVPLFLTFWGAELYGEWLILAAIPAYLTIADGGFANTTGRELSIRTAAGDQHGALVAFQSTWALLLTLSIAVLFVVSIVISNVPIADLIHSHHIDNQTARLVLALLVAQVLVSFPGGLFNGGFWCSGHYPRGMVLVALGTLLEFSFMAVTVICGGGPVEAAAGFFLGRAISILIMWFQLRRTSPWLKLGLQYATLAEVKRLSKPSFASLAFPLGNAFNIQGMRIVVGTVLGPVAVATYTTMRTLVNFSSQARTVLQRIVEPELAAAYGEADEERFSRLVGRLSQITFWLSIVLALGLLVGGSWILSHWTANRISMNWPLFTLLVLTIPFNAIWTSAALVLQATNRHVKVSMIYVLIYGFGSLLVGYVGAKGFGLAGAAVGLLAAEITMPLYVVPIVLRLSGLTIKEWGAELFTPPASLIKEVLHGGGVKNL